MKTNKKRLAACVGVIMLGALVGCSAPSPEDIARDKQQAEKAQGDTLEKRNLEEKRKREENPDTTRYLYLYSFGQPMGYYITKGKISSSGSQRTPEQDIHWTCKTNYTCTPVVVDGPKDDGSYGQGDPGIFGFLASGQMFETSFDYIISDAPITTVNVPLLGK